MAKDPAVLFYTSDFLVGVQGLTMQERGEYITLLCLQHLKGHLTEKEIKLTVGTVSEDVLKKFTTDENGLYFNERMDNEIEKRENFSRSRSENGKKGGRPQKTTSFSVALAKKKLGENENRNKDIIKDNRGVGEEEGRKNSPNKGSSKAFIPPTLEEVREYARSKDCEDIADRFYEYFTDGEWKDSAGKPVRSWKQKLLTWRNKEPAKNKPPDNKPMKYGTFDPTEALNNAIQRTFGNIPKRGADNGS
jgi:hypothetical protein